MAPALPLLNLDPNVLRHLPTCLHWRAAEAMDAGAPLNPVKTGGGGGVSH